MNKSKKAVDQKQKTAEQEQPETQEQEQPETKDEGTEQERPEIEDEEQSEVKEEGAEQEQPESKDEGTEQKKGTSKASALPEGSVLTLIQALDFLKKSNLINMDVPLKSLVDQIQNVQPDSSTDWGIIGDSGHWALVWKREDG